MPEEDKKAVTVVHKWDLAQKRAEAELAQTKAQLDQQQLLANQDLAKLKSQFDLITGLLPKGETKPSEGKVTADEKSGYLAELIGYAALDRVANGRRGC
jgi:hypothetical protein